MKVGVVVGMAMSDIHGIDITRPHALRKMHRHPVSGIYQHPEPIPFHQIPAAGLAADRPCPASADYPDSHVTQRTISPKAANRSM